MSQDCTGIAASWCPIHGDCTCPRSEIGLWGHDSPDCPLHGTNSSHCADNPDILDESCPACGWVDPDLWEYADGSTSATCANCEAAIVVTAETTRTFTVKRA